MTQDILSVAHDNGVAWVTIDRPEVRNAFDDHLIAELTATLRELDGRADVRAVVLAGAGKHFSAGADLTWMQRMASFGWDDNFADSQALGELMHTLNTLAQPTLARVQGAAVGGGLGLVACCDIAVASDRAVFALTEVKLGLIPAVIAPYVVTAIGERAARRYAVTGERFDAHRAHDLGLVQEVVPEAELDTYLATILDTLRENGPQAMRGAKRLMRDVARVPIDAELRRETARRIADQRASAEGQEGVAAFLNKRTPSWRDH
ncbi:methylglutaconyl-CoA hydratase [Limimonas halophila]|uniref:Methylglutaconyl-CoA hydratase n=1 Tax=Limimonas halophila TaxID=1082479 RepID=A0A1G7QJ95_9PROT|nr:enoyl-CoA hydratase/isomerase family protein [Limimonas halophila]SDF97989.1 methylglutaconyl-CoA hydratase [Limimonas halophila]